jgi:hypothetical protein
MKRYLRPLQLALFLTGNLLLASTAIATEADNPIIADKQNTFRGKPLLVHIPLMERASPHREYADKLLELALSYSEKKYGPYQLIQQKQQTVIRRQLLELEKGENLSVAVSMPMPEWLHSARLVQFPIMKGMASYRMFLTREDKVDALNKLTSLAALKKIKVGQGVGWSTAKILEDNGFDLIYGGPYETLLPMLRADRFQVLMRSVYEIEPEMKAWRSHMPELALVDEIAVYTYLPMYFFVSKKQPQLAERIEYGLKLASADNAVDKLFNHYFRDALALMHARDRKVFYLRNTNIESSLFERDKPWLLDSIKALEASRPR